MSESLIQLRSSWLGIGLRLVPLCPTCIWEAESEGITRIPKDMMPFIVPAKDPNLVPAAAVTREQDCVIEH